MPIDHSAMNAVLFAEHGTAATYTPLSGSPLSVKAIVEHGVDYAPDGYESAVLERRTVLHLRKTEIAAPKRGDTCAIGATTYTVEQLLDDDGYIVKAAVR